MDKTLFIPFLTAIGGFILGLATPFLKWEVDKRKYRMDAKIKLIEDIRVYCQKEDFNKSDFVGSVICSRIKHLFSSDLIYEIERKPSNEISFNMIGGIARFIVTPVDNILKEVAELEKEWGLV